MLNAAHMVAVAVVVEIGHEERHSLAFLSSPDVLHQFLDVHAAEALARVGAEDILELGEGKGEDGRLMSQLLLFRRGSGSGRDHGRRANPNRSISRSVCPCALSAAETLEI
jgi:hypothetical protein